MATIFSKIIEGNIPAYKILEDDKFLAFLDVFPLAKGHTLVIPKLEIDYIFDMEDGHIAELMVFTKKVALAIGKAIPCVKVGISVIGLEVPHAHVHLIPMQNVSDMNFSKEKLILSKDDMLVIAEKIKSKL
ncbi:MAG: HIT family protein [Saprospiraceae bacterium]|nr:HIT family protein [Saprospiraceae bacterium]